jgi:hypothetical protein
MYAMFEAFWDPSTWTFGAEGIAHVCHGGL